MESWYEIRKIWLFSLYEMFCMQHTLLGAKIIFLNSETGL